MSSSSAKRSAMSLPMSLRLSAIELPALATAEAAESQAFPRILPRLSQKSSVVSVGVTASDASRSTRFLPRPDVLT